GLHLMYWIVYASVVAMFILMTAHSQGFKLSNVMFIRVWDVSFFLNGAMAFYCSYTFLFSKYLIKKRILAWLIYSVLAYIVSVLLVEGFLFLYIVPNPGFAKMGLTSAFGMAILLFLIASINGLMGFVLRGFVAWYGDIKLKAELGKKNFEMELALVKNQINPHFLFNTLNNIDVLITKDAVQASVYLKKLSDIMRFMLYETKAERIPLEQELTYIEKYIDLQKIRTSNTNYVNYLVTGNPEGIMIAPMLFIPFIENAFKHSEDKKVENAIRIKVDITKEKIVFDCENKLNSDSNNKSNESGLGNELIKKRLVLLYPNRHILSITKADKTYIVNLTVLNNAD
ncbi:MAG TPA: histidine kinase, partial [Bacteroidia bacterium]|nr:histidine kinase [Bacteroidia bacterium]